MNAPPVHYAKTSNGYDIAYTMAGSGPPFVLWPHPFNHQQQLWDGVYREFWLEPLAARFMLIHFDARGLGMSSRGLPEDHTIERYLPDMDTVVRAVAPDHFVAMASYGFWRAAVRYAALHPGMIRALILFNPDPPMGPEPNNAHSFESLATMEWETFLFIQSLSYVLVRARTGSTVDQVKAAVTQTDYVRMLRAGMTDDARPWLTRVQAPTLIISERPPGVAEEYNMAVSARQIAAAIPRAQLVTVEGMGEAFYSDGSQPSLAIRLVEEFVRDLPAQSQQATSVSPDSIEGLSERELEVLRLIAIGKSNPEIAKELFITRNTVQNHVSSILIKTNLGNRTEAALYAKAHGLV
ncbi:MAG TPA: LuxR C-terminal-related transcriptional regulator [Dehalococcoidia bacterium]|nr:LuxR C-terminal-related transcriptional regulator [Dehalococcoidia bacterium]